MNREVAIRIAKSRTVIGQPGKYRVKVTTQPNLIVTDDISTQGPSRFLVNINAMSALQARELKQAIKDADAAGATDYQDVLNGKSLVGALNFSGSNGEVAPEWVPAKGEYVNIVVDNVYSARRDAQVLGVVAVEPVPISTSGTSSFSLDDDDEEEAEGAVQGAALHTAEVDAD